MEDSNIGGVCELQAAGGSKAKYWRGRLMVSQELEAKVRGCCVYVHAHV